MAADGRGEAGGEAVDGEVRFGIQSSVEGGGVREDVEG